MAGFGHAVMVSIVRACTKLNIAGPVGVPKGVLACSVGRLLFD